MPAALPLPRAHVLSIIIINMNGTHLTDYQAVHLQVQVYVIISYALPHVRVKQ